MILYISVIPKSSILPIFASSNFAKKTCTDIYLLACSCMCNILYLNAKNVVVVTGDGFKVLVHYFTYLYVAKEGI